MRERTYAAGWSLINAVAAAIICTAAITDGGWWLLLLPGMLPFILASMVCWSIAFGLD